MITIQNSAFRARLAYSKILLKHYLLRIFARHRINGWFLNDNSEQVKKIFIIGCGRSGNTLMRRLLSETSSIGSLPEFYQKSEFLHVCLKRPLIRRRERAQLFSKILVSHPEFHTFKLENIEDFIQTVSEKHIYDIPSIIDQFYLYYTEKKQLRSDAIIDKTPLDTLSALQFAALFPSIRFIFMRRQPLDAAISYVDAGIYATYEEAITRWNVSELVLRKLIYHHPSRVKVIQYEDLVTNTNETLMDVADFLSIRLDLGQIGQLKLSDDVAAHEHHRNVNREVTDKSINRWKTVLSDTEAAKLKGMVIDIWHSEVSKSSR